MNSAFRTSVSGYFWAGVAAKVLHVTAVGKQTHQPTLTRTHTPALFLSVGSGIGRMLLVIICLTWRRSVQTSQKITVLNRKQSWMKQEPWLRQALHPKRRCACWHCCRHSCFLFSFKLHLVEKSQSGYTNHTSALSIGLLPQVQTGPCVWLVCSQIYFTINWPFRQQKWFPMVRDAFNNPGDPIFGTVRCKKGSFCVVWWALNV